MHFALRPEPADSTQPQQQSRDSFQCLAGVWKAHQHPKISGAKGQCEGTHPSRIRASSEQRCYATLATRDFLVSNRAQGWQVRSASGQGCLIPASWWRSGTANAQSLSNQEDNLVLNAEGEGCVDEPLGHAGCDSHTGQPGGHTGYWASAVAPCFLPGSQPQGSVCLLGYKDTSHDSEGLPGGNPALEISFFPVLGMESGSWACEASALPLSCTPLPGNFLGAWSTTPEVDRQNYAYRPQHPEPSTGVRGDVSASEEGRQNHSSPAVPLGRRGAVVTLCLQLAWPATAEPGLREQ